MMDRKRIAIIGSSPISLFEAIYQSKLGNEVVLYDKRSQIGGAWSSIEFAKEVELELGCHIWDVDSETYQFIEKYIGEPLETLNPSPRIIFKNKSFPYDWKNNILFLKTIRHDFSAFISGKKFIKPILFSRKYKYPRKGSKQLLDKLSADLKAQNINVKLGQKVDAIDCSTEGCSIGKEYFDQVVLTSLSALEQIKTPSKQFELKFRTSVFSHIHLVMKGGKKKPLSYVRVMDHPFIHRISDISRYTNSENFVLAVGIFKHKTEEMNEEQLVREVKAFAIKHGWLSEGTSVIASYFNDFEASTIDHFQIKEIQDVPNLSLLRSTNFIFGLGNHVHRWKSQLIT